MSDDSAHRAIGAVLDYFRNRPVEPIVTYGSGKGLKDLSTRLPQGWDRNVIWAKQRLPGPGLFRRNVGIFLAGPTRRNAWSKCDICDGSGIADVAMPRGPDYDGPSILSVFPLPEPCMTCSGHGRRFIQPWRKDAILALRDLDFREPVFAPEPRGCASFSESEVLDHADQVRWEREALRLARVILFWIPRTLKDLPGFTTNIEFGEWSGSGKCVLGWPPGAEKMGYIEHVAFEKGIPSFGTLEETCEAAARKHG